MGDFQLNATCPLIRTFLRLGTDGLYCVTKGVFSWASIKPGTWNIPEHSGTSRNIPEHEKIKIIFMKKKKIYIYIKNNNNKIIFIKINNNVK